MDNVTKYIISVFIGSIVGFIGGFQGIAGGVYISMILLAFGVAKSQRIAAGTTLLAILWPISLGAVYEYWKTGDIEVASALIIAFFYTVFAWLGAKANKKIKEEYIVLSLASLMFLTSMFFFNKYYETAYGKMKL